MPTETSCNSTQALVLLMLDFELAVFVSQNSEGRAVNWYPARLIFISTLTQ